MFAPIVVKMRAFWTQRQEAALIFFKFFRSAMLFIFLPLPCLLCVPASSEEAKIPVSQVNDGVLVKTAHDQLHVSVCGPSILHVTAGPEGAKPSSPQQPWILAACSPAQVTLSQSDK